MSNSTDCIQRFLFNEGQVRGEIVQLEDSLRESLARGDYSDGAAMLLAESLTATTLMAGILKVPGRISLQARGQGPVSLLMADCSQDRGIRGLVHSQGTSTRNTVPELLGRGQLAITMEPANGQRYQGIVPLESETLSQCLEDYFTRSEQLDTLILLFADRNRAGGLMLQKMPGYEHTEDQDLWERLTHLAATTRRNELLDLSPDQVLHRLFHEEAISLYPPEAVRFHCHCNRERTEEALRTMGADECYNILAEQGEISVDCQFCNQNYRFEQQDLEQLFGPPQHH